MTAVNKEEYVLEKVCEVRHKALDDNFILMRDDMKIMSKSLKTLVYYCAGTIVTVVVTGLSIILKGCV